MDIRLLHEVNMHIYYTGMGEFNSDDHHIYYYGQESLRKSGVAIIVNKRVQNSVLGCNLKNDRMIYFQGKPLNIAVIKVNAPTSNAEEAEVEGFCKDLQDLSELIPRGPLHSRVQECKSRKSGDSRNNRQIWPWSTK